MIDQVRCRLRHALSVAGRAYPSPFAGIGNEKIMATFRATRPYETMGQNDTFEVAAELPLDIEWHRTAIPGGLQRNGTDRFRSTLVPLDKVLSWWDALGGMNTDWRRGDLVYGGER